MEPDLPRLRYPVFNDLRLNRELCDAVIKAEEVEFHIHRIVLGPFSPYFDDLFIRCSDPDQVVFNVPNLSAKVMQFIIEYAYGCPVSATEDNVQELLLAAKQLSVKSLIQMCCSFLREQLCPRKCIATWRLASVSDCPELRHQAYRYIVDHFEDVASYEDFLQLSVEELTDILDRDELIVKQEKSVYEAIMMWIAHEPTTRQEHIVALLSKVRLALLSPEYITINVLSNDLVKNSAECQTLVKDATTIIHGTDRPSIYGFCNRLARPRLPNAILLATGGWSGGEPTNSIEAYDFRADEWITVGKGMEHARAYHGTAFLNGSVYCVGGFNRLEHFNSVYRFDLTSRTWQEVGNMYCRRCYVSVTVLNGRIYAMGGYDGQTRLNSAECYQPQTNQWSHIAPMNEQRSDASSTTLHNKIYICGGFNGTECLQTAEYYRPETNQWTIIAGMSTRRSGIGVIAYADQIFAVGGFDGINRLRSAEAYNPETHTWTEVSSMITPRSNFGIEVIDDRLFAVGGFNGFTTTYNVESYDGTTNEWSEAADMDVFRSALSCCVVFGLPNMADYAATRDTLLHISPSVEDAVESEDSS